MSRKLDMDVLEKKFEIEELGMLVEYKSKDFFVLEKKFK